MHIVEEQRRANLIRFVVFGCASLAMFFVLFFSPQSISNGLWMPIFLVLFLALSFFSFLSIFYRREITIERGLVRVFMKQFLNKESVWELAVGDYERMSLRWHFASRFLPRARLRLLMEHRDPSKTLVLLNNHDNQSPEAMRELAQKIQAQVGAKDFFDESERVE